jgi:aminodeoxyfutalosine deaminase
MGLRYFSSDIIFPVSGPPIENGLLITDKQGRVLSLRKNEEVDPALVEHFPGALVPGFVNAHCHLELSHMKGVADTGTGLADFIRQVVTKRNFPPDTIQKAITAAEEEMYQQGIVAVGDISNTIDTFAVKQKGRLRYFTFVEAFDLMMESKAQEIFDGYKKVYDAMQETPHCRKSMSPHAPYSMSEKLFRLINETNRPHGRLTQSIHNQETPPENELFMSGHSDLVPLFESFGFRMDALPESGKTAIHYALRYLDPQHRTLFVHNTLSTPADVEAAHSKLGQENCFWVTCPNANLYIENRLPRYEVFTTTGATVCIGTDSLTSNWQLSILEEIKTILRYQSSLSFETVLSWATLNGAKALGWENDLGSFDTGKTPGIVHIDGWNSGELSHHAVAKRIL